MQKFFKKIQLPKNSEAWKGWFQKNKVLLCTVSGAVLFLVWANGHEKAEEQPQDMVKTTLPAQEKALVDPRDVWAYKLNSTVQEIDQGVAQRLADYREETKGAIEALTKTVQHLQQELAKPKEAALEATIEPSVRVIEEPKEEAHRVSKTFAHISNPHIKPNHKKGDRYVPSGAFARSVLLTGVVAETGTDAATEPQPILLRLVDHSIFSKGVHNSQVKDAILIGACHGHLSSERAICRIESVSLENKEGVIIEKPIQGWVIGEDGRPGIKGDVIDKASDVARMAILNGILGGIASFFQNQATASVYPVSPIAGQAKALSGMDALKAGGASGVGNALQKLADYAIKRAEQMNPVIMIGAGRQVDVVFKKGFKVEEETDTVTPAASPKSDVYAIDPTVAKKLNQAGLNEANKLQQLGGF